MHQTFHLTGTRFRPKVCKELNNNDWGISKLTKRKSCRSSNCSFAINHKKKGRIFGIEDIDEPSRNRPRNRRTFQKSRVWMNSSIIAWKSAMKIHTKSMQELNADANWLEKLLQFLFEIRLDVFRMFPPMLPYGETIAGKVVRIPNCSVTDAAATLLEEVRSTNAIKFPSTTQVSAPKRGQEFKKPRRHEYSSKIIATIHQPFMRVRIQIKSRGINPAIRLLQYRSKTDFVQSRRNKAHFIQQYPRQSESHSSSFSVDLLFGISVFRRLTATEKEWIRPEDNEESGK